MASRSRYEVKTEVSAIDGENTADSAGDAAESQVDCALQRDSDVCLPVHVQEISLNSISLTLELDAVPFAPILLLFR